MEDKVFDPEKVRRVTANADFGEGWYDYDVVETENYDKLLGLYRAAKEAIESNGGYVNS